MEYWTDQLQKGDVVEYNGYRRKVRAVSRKGDHVRSIKVAKRGLSRYETPITTISAAQLRSDSDYGIVDTDADLEETYLEEQVQRLVDDKPPRPPIQNDLKDDNQLY